MTVAAQDQVRLNTAFQQIAAIIRQEKHNDASVIRIICDIMPSNPAFALSFGEHVAAVLDGHMAEVDYTEVVVEAYRRALFAPLSETGPDTPSHFGANPDGAEEFVQWMLLMDSERGPVGARIHGGIAHLLH